MPNGCFSCLFANNEYVIGPCVLVCLCVCSLALDVVWSLLCAPFTLLLLLFLTLTSPTVNRIMYTSLYYNYTFYGFMYIYVLCVVCLVRLYTILYFALSWHTIRIFACPLFCLLKSFLCWFRHCFPLYEIVYVYTANTDH